HGEFHSDKKVRAEYVKETLRPLTHTRREAEQQFVIDTPSARERYGIPPGRYRTEPDVTRPGQGGMVRLIQLQRIRVSNVDSMMRLMPFYFRPEEAGELDFTCQFELSGPGGGEWVLRVCEQRCNVRPGRDEAADLVIRCDAERFLRIHRGEASAVRDLLLGRIRLEGRKELFLAFPRLFPVAPPESLAHRLLWHAKRAWRHWRSGKERSS
ncbi:MAG: SCP2 sterol-binding domain-containing protein, partial [Candidatus Binatia bacterium]